MALEHKEPDRVPVDYWASMDVSKKLCLHLNLPYEVDRAVSPYPGMMSAFDHLPPEPLLKYFEVDIRRIPIPYTGPQRKLPDGTPISYWGTPIVNSWGLVTSIYADSISSRPLANVKNVKQLDEFIWPDPDWWDFSAIEDRIEQYSEYATIIGLQPGPEGNAFTTACDLFGMKRFLLLMHMNPELAHAVVERIYDFFVEYYYRIFENGGGKADIFFTWDDVAHQDNLFISLKMWREYFKPGVAKIYSLPKKYGLRIMQHMCGAMKPLIPEFIELGMDILNPINVKAAGMVPAELKAEFGKKITFHGAVDVQHTLPFGSPEDVRREVQERVDVLGEKGGYIMASSHSLLVDIPIENVLTMYDTSLRIRSS